MKNRIEKFEKKTDEGKGAKRIITMTRVLTQEEDFVLTVEEIERMEGNAQALINSANETIAKANAKLEECKKLRDILKN